MIHDIFLEEFAKRILGEERYNNSPCQVHPLELVEIYVNELKEKLNEKTIQ